MPSWACLLSCNGGRHIGFAMPRKMATRGGRGGGDQGKFSSPGQNGIGASCAPPGKKQKQCAPPPPLSCDIAVSDLAVILLLVMLL